MMVAAFWFIIGFLAYHFTFNRKSRVQHFHEMTQLERCQCDPIMYAKILEARNENGSV